MKLKNLFVLDFKKPELDGEEALAYKRKESFLENLSRAYSRLETVEICNSNTKYEDSKLLAKALVLDVFSLLSDFYSLNKPETHSNCAALIERIPLEEIQAELKKLLELDFESTEEEDALKREEAFVKVLYTIEKSISKKHSAELSNRLDDYKLRTKLQAGIFSVLLLFAIYKGTTQYFKTRPLKGGQSLIEMTTKLNNQPDLIKKEHPYTPSPEWTKLEQILDSEISLDHVRISPIQESDARMQIRNLKVYDKSDKIVFEAPLLITDTFFQDAIGFIESENLKPGKYVNGRALEFESINSNPKIGFKWSKPLTAKKISWEVRMIKNYKKFDD